MTDPQTLTNGDARAAAVGYWLTAAARGETLTGADLAERYGRSDRWGRDRITEARRLTATVNDAAATAMTDEPGPETGSEPAATSEDQTTTFSTAAQAPELDVTLSPPNGTATAPKSAAEQVVVSDLPERPELPEAGDVTPRQVGPDPAVSPAPGRLARAVTLVAVVAVTLAAFAASVHHQIELAESVGESWPWLLPLSIDGLVVASTMALWSRPKGAPGNWLAWCALLLGLAASLGANVAMAEPTAVGRAVAAWPAVALGFSFKMVLLVSSRDE